MDQKNRMTLGLCMIAKNEESNIARCLESVKDITDEIVVIDTGSTDRTADIAKSFHAKVYNYKWTDDFSAARNYSIAKSKCDWILLLDADEELNKADSEKLMDFIHTTKLDGAHFLIVNYMGRNVSENYMLHNGFRLLRNNGNYKYTGEIHEQIVRKDGGRTPERFAIENIKVFHYGYLEKEVKSKQKRSRNIPILKKQLERNPQDAFALFNLGNEYLSLNDFIRALDYYEQSYEFKNMTQAYMPHLIFRISNCYDTLRQYDKAIGVLDDGLMAYPECTDFEFLRACLLRKRRRISMAIDSFKKCLTMGEPPSTLKFLEGCSTYRPAFLLGDMYFDMEDYENALKYYNTALQLNPGLQGILYRIGTIFNRQYEDKKVVYEKLYGRFADVNYEPNVIVATDILLNEKLYVEALHDLDTKNQSGSYAADFLYLKGKADLLTHHYDSAYSRFEAIFTEHSEELSIISNLKEQSARYMFAACLVALPQNIPHSLEWMRKYTDELSYKACAQIAAVYNEAHEAILGEQDNGDEVLNAMIQIFDILLKVSEYDLFGRLLPALNRANSNKLLLRLAEVYDDNGIKDMAVKNILRSIKELNSIDGKSVEILYRDFNEAALHIR